MLLRSLSKSRGYVFAMSVDLSLWSCAVHSTQIRSMVAQCVFVHGTGELLVWYLLERPVGYSYTN